MRRSYEQLLRGYSEYVRRTGHTAASEVALRTQSRALRDVMAYIATYNQHTTAQLTTFQSVENLPKIQYRYDWLAALGRVSALQAFNARDIEEHNHDIHFGLACLQWANRHLDGGPATQHFIRLEVELLARSGRINEALSLLEKHTYLKSAYYGYLYYDLFNPFVSQTEQTYPQWFQGFNKQFIDNGLAPISRIDTAPHKFNDLKAGVDTASSNGPKVTVIMTSYKPDANDFPHAVRSILAQTYTNFELLIVDDASPSEYDEILHKVAALDPRIKLLKVQKNGGTYKARNAGIAAASGQYLTGQDSDDWSHPERLAHQIEFLMANPASPGVVVEAVRMNDELIRTFPGRLPERRCEVSLMLRSTLAASIGGYIDARKGADSEFRRRLETITRSEVDVIEKPLYLTRIGHDSLSAADFKPGWSHPVRRSFWNASQFWHENANDTELSLTNNRAPLPIPARFQISEVKPPKFDIVFVSDWRSYGRAQRAMIDQIPLLTSEGIRVGVLHLESLLSPSKEPTRLCPQIQELINLGIIKEVIPDENAETTILILHDASILQFSSTHGINLRSNFTLIVADVAPSSGDNNTPIYIPELCQRTALEMFKGEVMWASTDSAVRQVLASYGSEVRVSTHVLPLALDREKWRNNRIRLSDDHPVVGRHAENFEALWTKNDHTASLLWPDQGIIDVRILGDARALLRSYNRRRYPLDWVVFRDQEITPEAFMRAIDFFVYYPSSSFVQAYSREALEAVASGALVILPPRFQRAHGRSAIYAEPAEVPAIIHRYVSNAYEFRERVREAQSALSSIVDNRGSLELMKELIAKYRTSSRKHHAYR